MPHLATIKAQDVGELLAQQRGDIENILMVMNSFKEDITNINSAIAELKADNLSGAARNPKHNSGFLKVRTFVALLTFSST